MPGPIGPTPDLVHRSTSTTNRILWWIVPTRTGEARGSVTSRWRNNPEVMWLRLSFAVIAAEAFRSIVFVLAEFRKLVRILAYCIVLGQTRRRSTEAASGLRSALPSRQRPCL